jgi:TRAP-type C4-dicarboxylate transport system permease small subunit
MGREKTPVLDVPFSWVFAPFLLFIALVACRYVIKFVRLLGSGWQEQL